MAERILNSGEGGGAYKRVLEGLTYRRSGDICKIIILLFFAWNREYKVPRLRRPWISKKSDKSFFVKHALHH